MRAGLLRRAITTQLRRGGDERFEVEVSSRLDEALSDALGARDPEREIVEALRWIIALETDLGSPRAARSLRRWIRRSESAMEVIRRRWSRGQDPVIFAALRGTPDPEPIKEPALAG
jgi:hypothetical protein